MNQDAELVTNSSDITTQTATATNRIGGNAVDIRLHEEILTNEDIRTNEDTRTNGDSLIRRVIRSNEDSRVAAGVDNLRSSRRRPKHLIIRSRPRKHGRIAAGVAVVNFIRRIIAHRSTRFVTSVAAEDTSRGLVSWVASGRQQKGWKMILVKSPQLRRRTSGLKVQ